MKNKLIGISIVIILIVSFSCFIIGASNENIVLLTFGLGWWFTFPSLLIIKQTKVVFPFLILGIAMIGYSILKFFDVQEVLNFIEENIFVALGAVFFMAGACLFWFTIGVRLWRRRHCTLPIDVKIESTIYDVIRVNDHNRDVGHSVYKYYYNGKEYICDSSVYNNIMPHGEGNYFVAHINPNKPEEIVIPLLSFPKFVILILSVISVISGIGVIILEFMS